MINIISYKSYKLFGLQVLIWTKKQIKKQKKKDIMSFD